LQHFDAQKNAGVDPQDVKRILGIFSSYKVQFLGILNKNNSRYILCNFFVDSISYYKRWESEFVLTEGRGYLSWRVTIDSEKQEIKFIHVN
jgi:hypothetical protein